MSNIPEDGLDVFGETDGEFSPDKLPWLDLLLTARPAGFSFLYSKIFLSAPYLSSSAWLV